MRYAAKIKHIVVSTHSRAKAAALRLVGFVLRPKGFQHTAARRRLQWSRVFWRCLLFCFNTQPREGGCLLMRRLPQVRQVFQHTAARRRLRASFLSVVLLLHRFNTQPREGGCVVAVKISLFVMVSTHSRAKAAASFDAQTLG